MLGYDGTVQDLWNETPAALRSVRCAFCHSMLFRGAVEKLKLNALNAVPFKLCSGMANL